MTTIDIILGTSNRLVAYWTDGDNLKPSVIRRIQIHQILRRSYSEEKQTVIIP